MVQGKGVMQQTQRSSGHRDIHQDQDASRGSRSWRRYERASGILKETGAYDIQQQASTSSRTLDVQASYRDRGESKLHNGDLEDSDEVRV